MRITETSAGQPRHVAVRLGRETTHRRRRLAPEQDAIRQRVTT